MELNILQTLSLLIIFLVIGYALQKNVKVLRNNYVPAPVIGGLLFSILLAITKNSFNFKLDFSALPIFVAVALMQNVVSLGIGKIFGKSSYDIMVSGSLGLMGDHTLGGLIPKFLEGGKPVMQSLASFSILSLYIGAIVGGLFFKKLKNKVDLSKNLRIPAPTFTPPEFLQYILIFVAGIAISLLPTQYGLGKYINPAGGGFILGLILRWIFDSTKIYEIKAPNVNLIGNFCLSMLLITTFSMFDITMIFKVSLYNLVLMIIQLAWLIALSYYVVFKLYKNNPLASYVATGLIGFSVGMPASTMSNLQCLTERAGALPMVLFIVPPVGAWIINIFNMFIIRLFL